MPSSNQTSDTNGHISGTATIEHSSVADTGSAVLSAKLEGLPKLTDVQVLISNEIVHLLSDQLYQSPLKAIEELVVNSWDAEAETCRLYVPSSDQLKAGTEEQMAIFDTGVGMTSSQMRDLWHIGNSKKRLSETNSTSARKQIGKFGIGKLATFTVGSQLTYVSKSSEGICSASLDFSLFSSQPDAAPTPVNIVIRRIDNWDGLAGSEQFADLIKKCGITSQDFSKPTWTLAIIEKLKPKAADITLGRLRWVLSTAMPMSTGFHLYLNGTEIESSKDGYKSLVDFDLKDLPPERLKSLNEKTGDNFRIDGDLIVSDTLKLGVRGHVRVTERTLPGKSDDLLRSHGFFVRVRGRLINEEEPFFGMVHLHHGTENRFNAQIFADDLDEVITAPREGVGRSVLKEKFETLLQEIFLYARSEYDKALDEEEDEETNKKEVDRSFVSPNLLEKPVAAALLRSSQSPGADADGSWFYTELPSEDRLSEVIEQLYTAPRSGFSYNYSGSGANSRLVKFDPAQSTYTINADHPFVAAHVDDPRAKILLEDILTAETMLETQLRTFGVSPQIIGEVLEERNKLLISLVKDHPFSHNGIAQSLIDSSADEHDLELALVAAARALGFVAKHISGSDEPDGIARYIAYPGRSSAITLEAKSSAKVPSLSAIDFAGLARHRTDHKADGVLLVAPSYPGSTREEDAAAAKTATELKISCWTVSQLAQVVKAAESRHFNAQTVIEIVMTAFSPNSVKKAIDDLFAKPAWNMQALCAAIIDQLEEISSLLPDMERTVETIAPGIARRAEFTGILMDAIVKASLDLASASQGALRFDGKSYVILASFDELRRRSSALLGDNIRPLRSSTFRTEVKDEA
ncbi:ATP-binding protein [Terriglobus sp. ADX1]|uniref:ATP-binding protein n=1 Tax=Terriglobus sp. ADX1 TaxID=2794063 RepID=UPI002FE5912B